MAGTVFIFGLGYVGRPLGHRLAAAGWQVRGTTRTPSRLAAQAEAGWQIHEFADDRPLADPDAALDGVDALITTITAIGGSDPVLDAHGELIADFKGWSGYVSATSVYPDTPDGFCYEDTPTGPATARGRARVEAEQRWLDLLGTEIFRAAGIYGPGRSPFDALRDGTSRIIEHRGQVFNRIHVEDICRVIEAAMAQPRRGRIINLADNKPAPQGDVVRHAAGLIGVEPPQPQSLKEANLSPMARSFYVSRRKVASKVIGPELGLDLLYPDYESGLAAILKAEIEG
ncbi:MAG: NAD(P)-binding domain-containing protein [Alphaproteobacteria bacterium]|jgi:nucleoside-diphosphate-sugar epimerase|nr:NAD(P)-dependent oxidoreductase [SAR116 cluster bacterium]MEC7155367.1 NAD(P)-binding domain-containing protein [Pseudomonadota bacterium]GIS12580.1 MAG: NAD(P)-dependent oxidoreductase [Alphaproteobacteria bacterium]MEC7171025.1 NAD(P)-binding domain-containing protein [Pseudomonadota bacterium]MEC7372037.1 NAD(P)-binding domain-containing protein [Pseudomonadota bacterium]|tara:strand:+ start:1324 stop:2181 length:858 start_codon:yes stop_codon:yes gene_type:complete